MRPAALWGLICAMAGALAPVYALQAQQLSAQVVAALTAHPPLPGAGASQPDVIIVEYLDYNCPYCRETAPELRQLLRADHGVQILFKEWPILGDGSIYAARSALAANWQGKFLVAHDALIGAKRDLDGPSAVDAILRAAGLDLVLLAADRRSHAAQIDALLARSTAESRALGLQGTPVFLVGRQLVVSSMTLSQLQNLVAKARANKR
jgi:protein-disulfide isomerase